MCKDNYTMAQLLEESHLYPGFDEVLRAIIYKTIIGDDITACDLDPNEIEFLENAGYEVQHEGDEHYTLEVVQCEQVTIRLGVD